MSNFHVGQKVVCIDDDGLHLRPDEDGPCKGQVYTIRGFNEQVGGLLLIEVINFPQLYREGYGELSFRPSRFRPVVERKTDISLFKAILDKPTVRIDA